MNTSLLLLGAMAIACSSGNCTTIVQPGYMPPPVIVEEPVMVVRSPLFVSRAPAPRPVVYHAHGGPAHHATPNRHVQAPQQKHSAKPGHSSGHSHHGGRK